jgi:hypothetical protein
MRWLAILLFGACAFFSAAGPLAAQELAEETQQAAQSGLSIVENGTDRQNNRLFTIQVDRVDVADVLRTFFKRAGVEAVIDQDVAGPLNITVKNVTFREALQYVVQFARPQIKVTKGKNDSVYHVSRDLEAQRTAEAIANRMQDLSGQPGHAYAPVVPNGLGPQTNRLGSPQPGIVTGLPVDRTVTIDVPDDHPIPLSEALSRISQQTRFPIYLDRRVPREISFAGTISEAPLSLVLQRLATTTGLKLLSSPTQATLVPPDQFTIRVSDMLMNQYPNMPCVKCGQQISSLWSFCPHCGQITPRGAQQLSSRPMKPATQGRK